MNQIEFRSMDSTVPFNSEVPRMLDGRTALVTGSTSGIGFGIANRLAEAGADIVLSGFGDVDGPMAQIQTHGVKVGYAGADMSNPDQIRKMMSWVDSEAGGTDILVNCAGIQYKANVEDFPTDEYDKVIAVNQNAYFHTTSLAIPGMRAKNAGNVINIASVHGLVASTEKSAYVAAKHAVVGLTKVVALETANTGITVNAICPGWVDTPMVRKQVADLAARKSLSLDEAQVVLLGEKQPSLRYVTPSQIGGLAVFMCSPDGASMTGSIVTMDGGWTAQ